MSEPTEKKNPAAMIAVILIAAAVGGIVFEMLTGNLSQGVRNLYSARTAWDWFFWGLVMIVIVFGAISLFASKGDKAGH